MNLKVIMEKPDTKFEQVEVGMLVQIQSVNRTSGELTIETDSYKWLGHFKGLSCHTWKEIKNESRDN